MPCKIGVYLDYALTNIGMMLVIEKPLGILVPRGLWLSLAQHMRII